MVLFNVRTHRLVRRQGIGGARHNRIPQVGAVQRRTEVDGAPRHGRLGRRRGPQTEDLQDVVQCLPSQRCSERHNGCSREEAPADRQLIVVRAVVVPQGTAAVRFVDDEAAQPALLIRRLQRGQQCL